MSPSGRVRHPHMPFRFPSGRGLPGLLVLSLVGALAGTAAQEPADWDGQVPAHVAVVDGPATLERDGYVEELEPNTVLVAGDRLRTDLGRVEVLFGDGTVLDLDRFTSVDVMADSLLRLLDGRVRLVVTRTTGTQYRIDASGGSAVIRTAGEYRLSAGDARQATPQLEVVVYRGSAELRNPFGTTIVRAGTYAVATAATVPSLPYQMNSAAWDEFDTWADVQRDARLGFASAQYLPADIRYYSGPLDRYGSWDYVADYGHVWYPQVGYDWYPYSHGSWAVTARFGWVWVGAESWSWPTHHYGRWGHHGGRWFWIPGRQWAPAWVSWASAPGYIGWSPLGFDNRPLIAITNISIHTGTRLGWSVVPERAWRQRVHVASVAVDHSRIRPDVWTRFAEQHDGPAWADARGFAVARPATTGRAVPRPGLADVSGDASARPVRSVVPDRRAGRATVTPPSRSTPSAVGRPSPRATTSSPSRAATLPSRAAPADGGSNTARSATPPSRSGRAVSREPDRQSSSPPQAAPPPRATPPPRSEAPSRAEPPSRSAPPPRGTAPSRAVPRGGSSPPPQASAPPRSAPPPRASAPASRSPAPSRAAPPSRGGGPSGPPSAGASRARPRTEPPSAPPSAGRGRGGRGGDRL